MPSTSLAVASRMTGVATGNVAPAAGPVIATVGTSFTEPDTAYASTSINRLRDASALVTRTRMRDVITGAK